MSRRRGSLQIACTLVSLVFAGAGQAQPYYSVTGGGGLMQIGDGAPRPPQDQISSMGGKNGSGGPIGTGTNFPPLLIPVNPNPSKALIKQTAGPDPKKMTILPGVFRRIPTTNGTTMGVPVPMRVGGLGVNNPNVLEVRTTLSFSAPAKTPGSLTFMSGQRTMNTVAYSGTPLGSKAIYKSKTGKRFGGVAQTRIKDLGGFAFWAGYPDNNACPCVHPKFGGIRPDCLARKFVEHPMTLAAAGGPKTAKVTAPGTSHVVYISAPTAACLIGGTDGVTPMGGPASLPAPGAPLDNMATSIGFPWTTGQISLSQPAALGGKENFKITGMDGRVNGVGTIQLVASSLSKRAVLGPNSNRAWAEYTLPEPGAVLGAAAALGVLGVCHALVRRRR